MKMTWFNHDPLDTDAANELLSLYAARNIQTRKTPALDPRQWLVSALLPETKSEPRQIRQWQNPMWR